MFCEVVPERRQKMPERRTHHVPKDGISILIAQQPNTYLVFPNKVYLYFHKIINAILSYKYMFILHQAVKENKSTDGQQKEDDMKNLVLYFAIIIKDCHSSSNIRPFIHDGFMPFVWVASHLKNNLLDEICYPHLNGNTKMMIIGNYKTRQQLHLKKTVNCFLYCR